jgi:hypothetical protein
MAERSLPLGEQGSPVQLVFDKVRRKLNVAATKKVTLPAVLAIIASDKSLSQTHYLNNWGSAEPTGNLRAPVHEAIFFLAPAAASALAAAAGAIQPGGGKGKGKGPGPGTYKQPGASP